VKEDAMKKYLTWIVIVVAIVAVVGFTAFLYVIPPLTSVSPDEFIKPTASAAPGVEGIADPALRQIAERGRYLVVISDCGGCHTTQNPQGPKWDMYLAGGMTFTTNTHGGTIARNLTPDRETGIGDRTGEQLRLTLRSGILHTGRTMSQRAMPWPGFSNWTDEDLHAVITYLRHIKPIRHAIPDPAPGRADALVPGSAEVASPVDAGK
jgi:cytochrome c5